MSSSGGVYGVVLLVAVVAVLASVAAGAVLAHRRAKDVAVVLVLGFTAYWTLVGAVQILVVKIGNPAARATYLEDRLFRVGSDGTYAGALLAYSAFVVAVVVLVVALVRERSAAAVARADVAAREMGATMAHRRLLVVLVALFAVKVAVLGWIVRGHSLGDLYELTRTAGSDRRITLYQYLNIATAYPAAAALAFSLGVAPARERRRVRATDAYGALLVAALVENAALGNRAVPLICLTAVAVGWLRWRFSPAPADERRRLAARFAGVAVVGLLLVGLIGAMRGGATAGPGRAVDAVGSVVNSSEKVAAHMSLDGVLARDDVRLQPLARDSYAQYAELVGAPPDQVFTVHYVTAWWLRLGAVGVAGAAGSFAIAVAALQRLATATLTPRRAGFVVAAATLAAAGVPVTLLRSGPESLRAVAVELVLIPGLVLLPAFWGGRRAEVAP
jgi:hypothetical protein